MDNCTLCGKELNVDGKCHNVTCPNQDTGPLADSGNRTDVAGTGGLRDMQPNKGRFDLLPIFGIQQVAIHFGNGAKKYSPRNWEKGLPLWNYVDSGSRHCHKVIGGLIDERHDRAWAWNAIAYLETRERIIRGELPMELTKDMHQNIINQIMEEQHARG